MKPVILLGEAQGTNEAKIGKGFVGSSGIELLRMLNEAGVLDLTAVDQDYIRRYWKTTDPEMLDMVWELHPEFVRMNVFNFHPQGNDLATICTPNKSEGILGYPKLGPKYGYVRAEFGGELTRLRTDLDHYDPNLIVCLGNTPLWALCGITGVSNLRGTTRLSTHTVGDYKVLAAYHPAAVLRQWELRPITIIDFQKIPRERLSPNVQRPARQVWIEPTIPDIHQFVAEHIRNCRLLSTDIETSGERITCIGFAPSAELAIVIPFDDSRRAGRSYWRTQNDETIVWNIIKGILGDESIPKLFQNGLYDIAFLWRSMKIKVRGAAEDTMLLHHALQPETMKGLGFLGSLYTDEGPWKQEHRTHGTKWKRDA